MLDLTGPPRSWPPRLVARFGEAFDAALTDPDCWNTPRGLGEPALLDRLGELFGTPPGRTLVTGGVRSFALAWAARCTCTIVETPSFSDIPLILATSSSVTRMRWDQIVRLASDSSQPSTIWLTSPFRNPDGRSLSHDLIETLARAGHQVIINEIYRWYGDFTPSSPRVTTVNSLAKIAGGGARIGWATVPSNHELGSTLQPACPASLWQRTWARFLSPASLAGLTIACIEPTITARREFVHQAAELLGWSFPSGGMSVAIESAARSEAEALTCLAARDITASPGQAFGMPVSSLRLAFSGVTAAEAREAARRIADLVSSGQFQARPYSP